MKFPQSKEIEYELVINGDTKPLVDYISSYIDTVLNRYEMSSQTYDYLKKILTDDIILARRRFIDSDGDKKDYKFSAYFSWYIHELLEKRNDIKRKPGI